MTKDAGGTSDQEASFSSATGEGELEEIEGEEKEQGTDDDGDTSDDEPAGAYDKPEMKHARLSQVIPGPDVQKTDYKQRKASYDAVMKNFQIEESMLEGVAGFKNRALKETISYSVESSKMLPINAMLNSSLKFYDFYVPIFSDKKDSYKCVMEMFGAKSIKENFASYKQMIWNASMGTPDLFKEQKMYVEKDIPQYVKMINHGALNRVFTKLKDDGLRCAALCVLVNGDCNIALNYMANRSAFDLIKQVTYIRNNFVE